MKKLTKLKICNWSLLPLTLAILISGIQLEVTHSSGYTSVWLHIIVGMLFMIMSAYHIFLHFDKNNWFAKFHKQKKQVTRILWWVSLATFITGVIASIHWLVTFTHSPIGGIHGKLGFLMIIFSVLHISKRIKFFKSKKSNIQKQSMTVNQFF
ncbi:MAG: hypothetical protein K2G17_03315 [Duncaniella sp.]|nr:hypothetical protein [Duncaniella sp.]MDE6187143.1 hypothetical protein [Duncaniella sp.]